VRQRLESVGRERALTYKTLVLTGLRKSELANLTVAQLRLDERTPYIDLDAADEQNREGNDIIIRADLADDLRTWLGDKLASLQAEALRRGDPIPARLPSTTAMFYAPSGLDKIFNRDLKLAGIAKRDERAERSTCMHCERRLALSWGGAGCRCERLKPQCGIPIPSSRRTSTPTRSFWTFTGHSTPCRAFP
jgi:integrase